MAVWFGVDAVAGEMWLGPVFASGVRRLGVANFGRGLLIGVGERDAGVFEEVAVGAGWRVWRVEPLFPEARFLRIRVPVAVPLRGHVGLVLYRRDATKFYEGLQRAYRYGLPSAFEPYVSSALLYGSVYRGYAVLFGKGSRGLAEKFSRLKAPLLARVSWLDPLYVFTPLDVDIATRGLVSGGYTGEVGGAVEIPVFHGYSLRLREGSDNSLTIIGAPGTGKSSFLDYLLSKLEGWNVLVLDVTGEHRLLERHGYRVLEAGVDLFINPLAMGVDVAYSVILGVIEAAWREKASPIVAYTLYTALQKSGTLLDAYSHVEKLLSSSRQEDERAAAGALIRRLRPMIHPALLGHGDLPRGRTVVDLSPLPEEAKNIFSLSALYLAYFSAVRGGWSGIIVLDEADRLGDTEVANRIADELRKYNVSIWAVGHSLARVARKLADAGTLMVFATNDPDNLETLATVTGWRDAGLLGKLAYGQALVVRRGLQPVIASLYIPAEFRSRSANVNPCLRFEDTARRHGADPLELMKLYVELFPHRHVVPRILEGEAVPRQEFEAFRQKAGKTPRQTLEALAEIYTCLENREKQTSTP